DDAGHLVAHRLARPRGHDRQRVAAAEDGSDHALLPRAERLVSEMPLERLARLRQLLCAVRSLHARPFASTVMVPQPTAPRGWLRPRPASFAPRPCSRRLAHRMRTPPTKAILPRPATDGKKK